MNSQLQDYHQCTVRNLYHFRRLIKHNQLIFQEFKETHHILILVILRAVVKVFITMVMVSISNL